MVLSDADLAKIRAAISEVQRAVERRDRLVRRARDNGATWTEIGFALGITAQGAQKRYGTGPERDTATREAQAASSIKRRLKAAKKSGSPDRADAPAPEDQLRDLSLAIALRVVEGSGNVLDHEKRAWADAWAATRGENSSADTAVDPWPDGTVQGTI